MTLSKLKSRRKKRNQQQTEDYGEEFEVVARPSTSTTTTTVNNEYEIEYCFLNLISIWEEYILKFHELQAEKVEPHYKNCKIAKTTGTTVGAVGAVMTIVGGILSPFTAGASLIVSAVGASIGVAGGMTTLGTDVADIVVSKDIRENIKDLQKKQSDAVNKLTEIQNRISQILQGIKDKGLKEDDAVQTIVSCLTNKSLNLVGPGFVLADSIETVLSAGVVAGAATTGKVIGSGVLRVVGIGGAVLFSVIDIGFLYRYWNRPHPLVSEIQACIIKLNSEILMFKAFLNLIYGEGYEEVL